MQLVSLDVEHDARTERLNQVKKRLKDGWRHEPKHLRSYFNACYLNWRLYPKAKSQQQVLETWAIYKQATKGDCPIDEPPVGVKPSEVRKWAEWYRLLGTPRDMAMRRFITYLAQIDPELIDVVPSEIPPFGFPLTEDGEPICAKCNTAMGCVRPLLDKQGNQLKSMLFNDLSLHNSAALAAWFSKMSQEQRCVFGVHRAITGVQAKPFFGWFNRTDNGGFVPYDASTIQRLIKEFVQREVEVLFQMQVGDIAAPPKVYETQLRKIHGLKEYYMALTGEDISLEIACSRDIEACNRQRLLEGGNHTHTVDLPDPDQSNDDFEEAIRLRSECAKFGLSVQTGVCASTKERCQIYRDRLQLYHERQAAKQQATLKLQERLSEHPKHKAAVSQLAYVQNARRAAQLLNSPNDQLPALHALLRKGAPHDVQSRGRLTPLIRAVIGQSIPVIEGIIALGADLDQVTDKGVHALMVAGQLDDEASTRFLLHQGASIHNRGANGRTATHVIAQQGTVRALQTVMLYVEQHASAQLRPSMVLDQRDKHNNTPLMIAVAARNMTMCKALVEFGADTNLVNDDSRTAAHIGRVVGAHFLAGWLESKSSGSVAGIETHGDRKLAKQLQFAHLKLRDTINFVCQTYDRIVFEETATVIQPFNPPLQKPSSAHFQLFMRNTSRHIERHHELLNRDMETLSKLRESVRSGLQCVHQDLAWIDLTVQAKPFAFNLCMCAAMLNDVQLIRELIDEGSNVSHANQYGTTPLMVATLLNNHDAMIALMKAGANIDQEDLFGNNCFAYAAARHHLGPQQPTLRKVLLAELDGECTDDPLTATALLTTAKARGIDEAAHMLAQYWKAKSNGPHPLQVLYDMGLSQVNNEGDVRTLINQVKALEDETRKLAAVGDRTADIVQQAVIRCPLCTLPIPCNHFSTAAQLLGYKRGRKRVVKIMDSDDANTASADLLEESHIASRLTDRSVAWTIYRQNCKVIDRETSKYQLQNSSRKSPRREFAGQALHQTGALIQLSRRQRGIQKIAAINIASATASDGSSSARDTGRMSIGKPLIGSDNPVPTRQRKVFMFAEVVPRSTSKHGEMAAVLYRAGVLHALNSYFFDVILPAIDQPPVVDEKSCRRTLPECSSCGAFRVRASLKGNGTADTDGRCVMCQFSSLMQCIEIDEQLQQSNQIPPLGFSPNAIVARLTCWTAVKFEHSGLEGTDDDDDRFSQENAQADVSAVCVVFIARGQLHEAQQLLQSAITTAIEFDKPDAVLVADMFELFANLCCYQGAHCNAVLAAFEAVELLVNRLGFNDTRTKRSIYTASSMLLKLRSHTASNLAEQLMQKCCAILASSRIQSKQLASEELASRFAVQRGETAERRQQRHQTTARLLESCSRDSSNVNAMLRLILCSNTALAASVKQQFVDYCQTSCTPMLASATDLLFLILRYEDAHIALVARQILEDIVKRHVVKPLSTAIASADGGFYRIQLPDDQRRQFALLLTEKHLPPPSVFDDLLPIVVQEILPCLAQFCRSSMGQELNNAIAAFSEWS